MWVLALLAISSSLLAFPAAAQLGAYSLSEPGAYGFDDPGTYSLAERAEPGAYSFAERATPGAYSFAERSQPGQYSFAEPGQYSLGADDNIPVITLDDLAAPLQQQLQPRRRNLLAVDEVIVPASIPASNGDSSSELELDIVPAELPASKSWDSQNWQSWEQWYAQHFNSQPDVGGAGAYGMSFAGDYGQGSYGYGGYGGSSYGSAGAYFDFRSNRAFVPEQAVNTAAPDSTALPAGTLVQLPSSSSGAGARLSGQQLHMAPTAPMLSGISRGRGLSLGLAGGQESAAAAAGSPSFTGQANLAALNLQMPEQQAGPGRRLLAKAADVLSALAGNLRLSEAAAAPGYFARRLHMARSN